MLEFSLNLQALEELVVLQDNMAADVHMEDAQEVLLYPLNIPNDGERFVELNDFLHIIEAEEDLNNIPQDQPDLNIPTQPIDVPFFQVVPQEAFIHDNDDEIPEDLLEPDLLANQDQAIHQQVQENLQIGAAQLLYQVNLFGLPLHKVASSHKQAEHIRLWAKYLAPGNTDFPLVNIPADWSSFFTLMLLSLTHFTWAKNFLSSATWKWPLFSVFSASQSSMLLC